jgi:hypothetical protein
MTNLTSDNNAKLSTQEQILISSMDERLKRLELLLDEALEKETPETLKQWLADKRNQPIDTTKGEPIETEQRWKPKHGQKYFVVDFINEGLINWYDCENDDIDKLFIKNNNCFKTEQEAQKAAEAIKQCLSANKF